MLTLSIANLKFVKTMKYFLLFEGCVRYIFASLFLSLKEGTCETRKNVSYFFLKALFVLKKIDF